MAAAMVVGIVEETRQIAVTLKKVDLPMIGFENQRKKVACRKGDRFR
jgi:hypothetical protein